MKALVYTANQEMTYRDEPAPQPASGEALVAIDSVGICGSDMHAYLGHDPRRVPPLILGHEAVGTVLEGARAGESVVLNPLITCGVCDACLGGRQNLCAKRDLIGMFRAGAFAEQIAIPERNLIAVPNGMDAHKAALTEPGATALHAVSLAEKTLSRPVSEARALVIGGGSVGLLTALFLLDKGATEVHLAETNPLRRATAEAGAVTGVNANIEPRRAQVFDPRTEPPDDDSYDAIFDAVGNAQTRNTAIKSARPGAVIVHIGLADAAGELDVRRLTLQEITFIGCYTYTPTDLQQTLAKLAGGALGALDWLEQRPLSTGADAFKELLAGECAAAKIVLQV